MLKGNVCNELFSVIGISKGRCLIPQLGKFKSYLKLFLSVCTSVMAGGSAHPWSLTGTYSSQCTPQVTGSSAGELQGGRKERSHIPTPLQPLSLREGKELLHNCYCNLRGWHRRHILVHCLCRAKGVKELCISGSSPHLSFHHVTRPSPWQHRGRPCRV